MRQGWSGAMAGGGRQRPVRQALLLWQPALLLACALFLAPVLHRPSLCSTSRNPPTVLCRLVSRRLSGLRAESSSEEHAHEVQHKVELAAELQRRLLAQGVDAATVAQLCDGAAHSSVAGGGAQQPGAAGGGGAAARPGWLGGGGGGGGGGLLGGLGFRRRGGGAG